MSDQPKDRPMPSMPLSHESAESIYQRSLFYDNDLPAKPVTATIKRDALIQPEQSEAFKINQIAGAVEHILQQFPVDLNDPNFESTPLRYAKALVTEWLSGYFTNPADVIKVFPNTRNEEGLVIEYDIPFYSMCAHHIAPFFGKAAIAYIPNEFVLGLSKFARIVNVFANRLQLQELITQQIADELEIQLKPRGVMVVLYDVTHTCVCSRGIHAVGAKTSTSVIRGLFRNVPALRDEALSIIKLGT